MNIQSNKAFQIVTLCSIAILWSCKKDEQPIPKASAAFTSTVDALTGGVVTFTNTSENATSYAWDFGDGNTSKEKNPTNKYTESGNYTVKLTATNTGGSDEETKTVIIKLKGTATDTQLIANFIFELDEEGVVKFTNTSENATSYAWDFGDGKKSNTKDTTYKFIENKDYAVKLTATNSAGESADTTKIITITNALPIASFKFSKDPQLVGGTINFENTSKNATSYAWDFGDGNTSTDENPTHSFTNKDSTYTVKLTATNKDGSADTTQTVTIEGVITIAIADLSQLAILENRPKGTLIGEITATVANSEETPVYSITSQSLAGAIALEGNKMVVADSSSFDYKTNTEVTGEIQATVGSVSATAAFTVSIEEVVNIPDANFKSLLVKDLDINTNGDGEISAPEARAFRGTINANLSEIKDATGIEYFINLTRLTPFGNSLTKINVSQNTALTILYLGYNQLTAIDVSNNKALTELHLENNPLTAIDVSNNTALTRLLLNDNDDLTKVNLANGNNDKLTSLNLENTPNLTCVQVDQLPIPNGWRFDNEAVFQTTECN